MDIQYGVPSVNEKVGSKEKVFNTGVLVNVSTSNASEVANASPVGIEDVPNVPLCS